MTGKNVYTMTAMTRRAFVGLAVMAAQAGLAGCVRNGAPDAGSSDGGAGKSGDAGTSSPFAPQQSAQASVDGISIDRVTIEHGAGRQAVPLHPGCLYLRERHGLGHCRTLYRHQRIPGRDQARQVLQGAGPAGAEADRARREIEVVHGVRPRFGDGSGHGQGDGARREGAEVGAMLLHREPGPAIGRPARTSTHICICASMRLRTCAYG